MEAVVEVVARSSGGTASKVEVEIIDTRIENLIVETIVEIHVVSVDGRTGIENLTNVWGGRIAENDKGLIVMG